MGAQEFLPYRNGRAESKHGAKIKLGALDDVGNLSFLNQQRIAVILEGQRKRCGEPVPDGRQFLVCIDALSIACKSGISGIFVATQCHVTNSNLPRRRLVIVDSDCDARLL